MQMAGQNILTGGIAELNEIKNCLVDNAALHRNLEKISEEKKQMELEKEELTEQMKKKSEQMVESRRNELCISFDKEIQKENMKLREIRGKRERALKKGIENRIEEETAHLRGENQRIQEEIKTVFKQERVPFFCNSTLYYSLFMPKGIRQIGICVLTALLFVIAVPVLIWSVWQVSGIGWMILKVLVEIGYFTVVGVIYFLVFAYTKDKHNQILEDRRTHRQQMIDNKKEIKKMIRRIRKDKNEGQYNLASFDQDIKEVQKRIQSTGENKKKALDEFEKNIISRIVEETTRQERKETEELQRKIEEKSSQILALENEQNQLSAKIASEYTAYLGSAYMTIDKLDQLINMISSGQAGTIQEGINILSHQE